MNKKQKRKYKIGLIICIIMTFLIAVIFEGQDVAALLGTLFIVGIIYFANKIDKINKQNNNTQISDNFSFNHSNWGFSQKEFDDMKQQIMEGWKNNKVKIPYDKDVYFGLIQKHKVLSKTHEELEYYCKMEEEFLKVENEQKNLQNLSQELNNTPLKFKVKVKNDTNLDLSNFSKDYLNTKLDDGMTIKEHMHNGYKKEMFYNSPQYKTNFPKNINEQYIYIISHIDNRSTKYQDIKDNEEKILKIFLEKVSLVRKKYSIRLERQSDGMIRIYYNDCPTGQFNLRDGNKYIRVLKGLNVIDKYDVTYDEMLNAIDSWVRYCKYQLAESRF